MTRLMQPATGSVHVITFRLQAFGLPARVCELQRVATLASETLQGCRRAGAKQESVAGHWTAGLLIILQVLQLD
jgi:hypothetical protein